ncbi:glycosyltransferase [Neobacillus mesonae]|uniref:glycosyltransferase n=1 Tax=Neobacillus mesonae TaxID=1193713 RepID=UPI00203C31A6|nr:glycosyltransferase [Neobacillus mesonae]MCM3568216.1 glycosyltransferase [Neobacillus mesonae]
MEKKSILITSFDLAIGGVERSLIGLLSHIDYNKYDVDLMLFKHEGEFFPFLPSGPNLIPEMPQYATFRMPIGQIAKKGLIPVAVSRTMAKYFGSFYGDFRGVDEPGYLEIQYGWEFTTPLLPKLNKEYDVAIGFLWPHHFITQKVKAKKKIGWIHTDYSNIYLNQKLEAKMWRKLDSIVAVSEECANTFLKIFPEFKQKTCVIENILSPALISKQSMDSRLDDMKTTNGRTTILTIGRLSHAKGLDNAVKACRELVDEGFDVGWYVVGYGPLENELKDLINELNLNDRFFLLGKKTNPYPYLKACDIYVQPSRYEGKAVTIREAQILGKPVVITNFPTAKSQAIHGIDAIITDQGVSGIAAGIKTLLTDRNLKERLISNVLSSDYGNEQEIEKLYSLIG